MFNALFLEMAAYHLDWLNELIWNRNFWLPKNQTWTELKKQSNSDFNNLIVIPLTLALLIYAARLCVEK